MAFTVSNVVNTVMGDKRINILRVTADGASSSVITGLNNISHACLMVEANGTAAATAPVLAINAHNAGTATAGAFALTGCVSGGIYSVMVISPA